MTIAALLQYGVAGITGSDISVCQDLLPYKFGCNCGSDLKPVTICFILSFCAIKKVSRLTSLVQVGAPRTVRMALFCVVPSLANCLGLVK